MKTIFYNEAEQNIRAGWRMGIFTALFFFLAKLLEGPVKFLSAHTTIIPQFVVGEILVYGVLLATTWGVLTLLEKRPAFASVGLPIHRNVISELGQGFLMGGGMMTVIFVTEYSLGLVTLSFKPWYPWEFFRLFGASSVIFVVGAFGEELMFRGYLFQTMVEGTGKTIAVAAFALFFGAAHANNPNVTVFSLINVALAGVWLSIAYFKTRALWFPIALHFSWNFMQNHVFSFPVSGLHFSQYQLGFLAQTGPTWLTGGAFGPEGGALATIMLVVSGCLIYFTDWVKPSEGVWTLEQWKAERAAKVAVAQAVDPNAGIS